MSTTLFDAKPYDPRRDRRRNIIIGSIILAILILLPLAWWFRHWPEEHKVDQFFTAIEQKDFEKAYGIWVADKDWKLHPQKFTKYPIGEFYIDWGPGGEWGLIRSHKVDGSAAPRGGSGVVVVVTVNDRVEKARIWVEKSDQTLSFSPF
ncbi:MAG TPA: hypothetical protein VN622_10020 [Clostridia bacterium]|nr:hypothetical protein [Clostridia bacterium]